jgi:hypothetical protein
LSFFIILSNISTIYWILTNEILHSLLPYCCQHLLLLHINFIFTRRINKYFLYSRSIYNADYVTIIHHILHSHNIYKKLFSGLINGTLFFPNDSFLMLYLSNRTNILVKKNVYFSGNRHQYCVPQL